MKDNILTFFKGRFPLVIILLIIARIISPLRIQEYIYIIVILTIVMLLYSLLHKLGHAIAAILLGIKVDKFSINRVYFEDEPTSFRELESSNNKLKYGVIAISGSTITILTGYILLFIAHRLRLCIGLIDFLCWIFTLVVFLLGDIGYLIVGSATMQGDPVGISAGFNISNWIIFCFALIIAIINILLIWRYFWFIV